MFDIFLIAGLFYLPFTFFVTHLRFVTVRSGYRISTSFSIIAAWSHSSLQKCKQQILQDVTIEEIGGPVCFFMRVNSLFSRYHCFEGFAESLSHEEKNKEYCKCDES